MCGGDEAGRGAVIGPLVIALVAVRKSSEHKFSEIGVRDSKLLSKERRERLYKDILKIATEIRIDKISPSEIDEALTNKISLNELEAIHFAKLLDKFDSKLDRVYLDSPDVIEEKFGVRINLLSSIPFSVNKIKSRRENVAVGVKKTKLISEHKADSTYPVVSAASIVAKTVRDREVRLLERRLNIKIGSGYPSDLKTIDAIRKNLKNRNLHKHIRNRWSTMERIKQMNLSSFFNK